MSIARFSLRSFLRTRSCSRTFARTCFCLSLPPPPLARAAPTRAPPRQACRAQRADLARLLGDTGGGGGGVGGGGEPTLVRLVEPSLVCFVQCFLSVFIRFSICKCDARSMLGSVFLLPCVVRLFLCSTPPPHPHSTTHPLLPRASALFVGAVHADRLAMHRTTIAFVR